MKKTKAKIKMIILYNLVKPELENCVQDLDGNLHKLSPNDFSRYTNGTSKNFVMLQNMKSKCERESNSYKMFEKDEVELSKFLPGYSIMMIKPLIAREKKKVVGYLGTKKLIEISDKEAEKNRKHLKEIYDFLQKTNLELHLDDLLRDIKERKDR